MEERSPDDVAAIAIHYERAGLPLKAYPSRVMAGHQALAMYAQAEARRFFEIAERAAPTTRRTRDRAPRVGRGVGAEGRHALTEELCDRALADLADGSDEHTVLGLRRMRERTRSLQGKPARETITAAPSCSTGPVARRPGRGVRAAHDDLPLSGSTGRRRAAEDVAREAVAAAQAANDSRLLAESLTRLGSVDHGPTVRRGRRISISARWPLFRRVGRPVRRGALPHQHRHDPPARRRQAAAEAAYDRALETANSRRRRSISPVSRRSTLACSICAAASSSWRANDSTTRSTRFTESSNETAPARRRCTTWPTWPARAKTGHRVGALRSGDRRSRRASVSRTSSSARAPDRRSRRSRWVRGRWPRTRCAGFAPTSRRARSGGSRAAISSTRSASVWRPSEATTRTRSGCFTTRSPWPAGTIRTWPRISSPSARHRCVGAGAPLLALIDQIVPESKRWARGRPPAPHKRAT